MRLALILGLLLAAAAVADEPPASAPTPATPAASTPAAVSASAAKTTGPSPEVIKKARQHGYHIKKKDGVLLYCREDAAVGTRISSEKCLSEDEFNALIRQNDDTTDQLRRGTCGRDCMSSG
jgi:hypothetical protein